MHADDRTRLRWTALGGEHGGGGIGPPGTAASTGGVDGRLNTREATAGVRSLLAYPRTAGVRGYARICEGGGGEGDALVPLGRGHVPLLLALQQLLPPIQPSHAHHAAAPLAYRGSAGPTGRPHNDIR